MKNLATAIALAAGMAAPGVATAQVVTLGSTNTGATSQIGRAIAAVVSAHAPLQMRPQEMANTADYMPLVGVGEIDFGISNVVQLYFAHRGEGMSPDRPSPELRTVAVLMPFRASLIVEDAGDIERVEDLRGLRVPDFPEASLGYHVMRAYLANGGLTYDDVVGVPVPNFPRMWDSFREGSTDAVIDVPGSASSQELNQAVGGIRFLSFDDSDERLEEMQEWLPQMYFGVVEPGEGLVGIEEPTIVKHYDYTFFAHSSISDDTVYEVVKALYENAEELIASGPIWTGFERDRLSLDIDVPFHPGAIRFFEEAGIWHD